MRGGLQVGQHRFHGVAKETDLEGLRGAWSLSTKPADLSVLSQVRERVKMHVCVILSEDSVFTLKRRE